MSEIKQHLEVLSNILLQETEIYQQLLFRQQEEKRFLVEQALPAFIANLQVKESLAWKITKLEKERNLVSTDLASLLHLSSEAMTLQQLSTWVDEPYATNLLHYRSLLQMLFHDLNTINRENEILLRDSLAFIEGALAFFERVFPQNVTYLQSGKFIPHKQGRLLAGKV